jgi:hypothetical protein
MSSTYGARHGLEGYDAFRTGLRFATVQGMLRVESEDPRDWRHKSRGCVLGLWHSLKMALYGQACDIIAKGPSVDRIVSGWNELIGKPTYAYQVTGDVQSVKLRSTMRPTWFVVIHRSPKGRDCWQVSYFDEIGAMGDHERPTLEAALDDYELQACYHVEKVL